MLLVLYVIWLNMCGNLILQNKTKISSTAVYQAFQEYMPSSHEVLLLLFSHRHMNKNTFVTVNTLCNY